MKRPIWLYLILAYAFTWLIWITAEHFGVGPALAAIFLSRRGQDAAGE